MPSFVAKLNLKAFVSLSVAIFVAMLGMGIISPLMSIYATGMGASGFWLGIMYSGFAFSRTIVMPFAGWFSDLGGRKRLMIVGLTGYTILSVLYVAAANIYQLTAVRLLHGIASAMVVPIAHAYIGDIIPGGREGTYMNLFSMAMFLGMGVGPLLGGALSDAFNVATVFYTMGAIAAIALILLITLVPPSEPASEEQRAKSIPFATLIRDNRLKAVCVFMATRGILRQSIVAFFPLFAVSTLGMSRSVAGALVSSFMLAEGLSGGLFGPFADKFNRKALMLFGSFVGPALAFLIPAVRHPGSFIAVLLPMGLMGGMGRAPALAYNVEAGAKYGRMGSAMGIVHGSMALGHFIGPLVAGYMIDRFSVGSVFYFGAALGVVSTLLISYWLSQRETQVTGGT